MLDNEYFCCGFSGQILFGTIGKDSSFLPNSILTAIQQDLG
jgi:hypothetical protein